MCAPGWGGCLVGTGGPRQRLSGVVGLLCLLTPGPDLTICLGKLKAELYPTSELYQGWHVPGTQEGPATVGDPTVLCPAGPGPGR